MTREKHYLYDLDGTLSRLNNTFDFIYNYYDYKGWIIRRRLFRLGQYIINRQFYLTKACRRKLVINLFFRGLSENDLISFYYNYYEGKFMASLTPLALESFEYEKKSLVTGCTEVPAVQIACKLKMQGCICTTFKKKNGIIKGIKTDTYANKKASHIERQGNEFLIYYTDDEQNENEVFKKVDEAVVIKY